MLVDFRSNFTNDELIHYEDLVERLYINRYYRINYDKYPDAPYWGDNMDCKCPQDCYDFCECVDEVFIDYCNNRVTQEEIEYWQDIISNINDIVDAYTKKDYIKYRISENFFQNNPESFIALRDYDHVRIYYPEDNLSSGYIILFKDKIELFLYYKKYISNNNKWTLYPEPEEIEIKNNWVGFVLKETPSNIVDEIKNSLKNVKYSYFGKISTNEITTMNKIYLKHKKDAVKFKIEWAEFLE